MFSKIIFKVQDKLKYLYDNSLFLQKIDTFIFGSVIAVIFVSTFLSSDYIGFIALVTMFLTFVKIMTKQGDKFTFNHFELFLAAYFMIVLISLAGSSLFALSLKGFLKTFIYIGFYFSAAHYFKNNLSKIPYVIAAIALCIGFESIIAVLQNSAHVEAISGWQDTTGHNPEEIMTRVYGTLKPFNPNLLGGYFVYVPITFVIKGLVALCCGLIFQRTGKHPRLRLPAVAAGGIVDILLVAGGYCLCEIFLYGLPAALAGVPANLVQGVSGLIISLILYPILSAIPDVRQLI